MEFKKFGSKYVVRIDKGEEIVTCLEQVVGKNNIQLGFVEGIGAVNEAQIGLFAAEIKQYQSTTITGDLEITSLKGNISTKEGKPYLHLHINLADARYKTYGGHLNRAVVSGTCELIIVEIAGTVERKFSNEVGLNLYHFPGDCQ